MIGEPLFLSQESLCLIYGFIFSVSLRPETSNDTKNDNIGDAVGFSEGWALVLFALLSVRQSEGLFLPLLPFLIPRYFEVYMSNLSLSIAVTGILAFFGICIFVIFSSRSGLVN